MAKDYDLNSDMNPDVVSDTGGNADADFGGELVDGEGVDLNAGDVSKANIARRGLAGGLAGMATVFSPFAPLADQPTEYQPPPSETPAIIQPIDAPKTPEEWAAEIGATIEEGGPVEETDTSKIT